jgi:hypothetical protein
MNNNQTVDRITTRTKTIYLAIQQIIDGMEIDDRYEIDELVAQVAASLGMKTTKLKPIVVDYLHQTEIDKLGFVRKGAGGGYIRGVRPEPKKGKKSKKVLVEEMTIDEADTSDDEGVANLVEDDDQEIAV